MRKIYLLFLMLLIAFTSTGQTVTIGSGTSTSTYPFGGNYGYNRSAALYLSTEINQTGGMLGLSWDLSSSLSTTRPIKIYLKEVTTDVLVAQNWTTLTTGATLVYEGSIPMISGWNNFILSNVFNYSGGENNLLVLVETNMTGSGGGGSSSVKYTSSASRNLQIQVDGNPPTGNLTLNSNRPNIRMTFGPAFTCFAPSMVNISNITDSGMMLNWLAPSVLPSNGYIYEVRTDANPGTPGAISTREVDAGTLTANVTGLVANTVYNVYLRSNCDTDDLSTWSIVKSFRTLCGTVSILPYVESFDSSSTYPTCWSKYPENTTNISINTIANSSPNSIRFYGSSTDPLFAITPVFEEPIQNLRVKFKLRRESASYSGDFTVGVLTDVNDVGSFVPFAEFPNSLTSTSEWRSFEVNFNSNVLVVGSGKQIAFRQSNSSTNYYFWLDDVEVSLIPNCADVTGLVVNNVTMNSANLSWNTPTVIPSNGYQYEIRTSGGPNTGTDGLVSSGNVMAGSFEQIISQLSPNTVYKAYLKSNCGTNTISEWSAGVEFRTALQPNTLPYFENFNGANLNFAIINGTPVNKWVISNVVANSTDKALYVTNNLNASPIPNTYTTSSASANIYAYTDITIPTTIENPYQLSFDYVSNGESGWDDLTVWLVPTDLQLTANGVPQITSNSNNILLGTYQGINSISSAYINLNMLANYAGQARRLVFYWRNDGGGGSQPPAYIDNVKIAPLVCEAPAITFSVSTLTDTSAQLILPNDFNGEYEYEIRTNLNVGQVTTARLSFGVVNTATSRTVNITGLAVRTNYYVFLRKKCSSTEASAWVIKTFILRTSNCTPLVVPTTVENFEAYGGTITATSLPCWNEAKLTNGLLTYNTSDWISATLNGTKVAQITLSGAKNDWLISPVINLSSNSDDLRLTYKSAVVLPTGATALPEDKSVKVLISTDGGETWNTNAPLKVYTGTQIPGSAFTNEEIDLAGYTGNVRFAFVATSTATTSGLSFSIDDFRVDTYPICRDIPSVEYSQLTKNSVKVSWAQPSLIPTQGYQILVFTANQTDLSDANVAIPIINVSNTTLEHVITGLSALSSYKIFVRTNCGATEVGLPSRIISLTTLCDYPDFVAAPTSIPTLCGIGTATLSAAATNNGSVAWYSSQTGGQKLATTNTYITDTIRAATSYWVETQVFSLGNQLQVGNGTTTTSTTLGANPFYSNYGGIKSQYIFTAEELFGFGLAAGEITSLGFEVVSAGTVQNRKGFAIKIGHTEASSNLTNNDFVADLDTVYLGQEIDGGFALNQAGVTMFEFDTPFVWNGQQNIVVQISWNIAGSSGISSSSVRTHSVSPSRTSFLAVDNLAISSTSYLRDFSNGVWSPPTSSNSPYRSNSSLRPNTYFNGMVVCSSPRTEVVATVTPAPILELSHPEIVLCEGDTQLVTVTEGASSYDTYVWEPATGVTGNATTGWTFAPTENTNYTLRATQSNGTCVNGVNINVVVNPKPITLPLQEIILVCKDEILPIEVATVGGTGTIITSFDFENGVDNSGFVRSGVNVTVSESTSVSTSGTKSLLFNSQNDADGYLTMSQGLDLSSYTNPQFKFDNIALLEGNIFDFGNVQYLNNQGVFVNFPIVSYQGTNEVYPNFDAYSYNDWWDEYDYSPRENPENSMWKNEVFNIPNDANLSDFKIRFKLKSDGSVSYLGWFIDNVMFTGTRVQETTWSPVANLYTDAAATIPYVAETPADKVYFKATAAMPATTYTAITSNANCSVTQTTSITAIDVVEPIVVAQTICEVAVTNIEVSGLEPNGTLKWYATEDATEAITEITTTGTYYVEQVVGGCKSDRVSVVITYNPVLPAPTAEAQVFCEASVLATVADLVATGTGTIGWFLNEDDETVLASTESLQTRTYYVAQSNGNCWSPKTAVSVESAIIPPVPVGGEQSYCGALALGTVPIQTVPGGLINWYDTETSGVKLSLTDVISNRTYYISQSIGNCESARVLIDIEVIPTYAAPVAAANQLFCTTTTFADIDVTLIDGATIGWFSSQDLAEPDLSLTANVVTGTYYVSQFNGACWSPKTRVDVTVNTKPVNLVNTPQQLCGVFTLADAVLGQVPGATVKFYTTLTTTDALPMTTPLVSGTYFVSQTVGGCESDRVAITFTVSDVLPAPQVNAVQLFCGVTTVANLNATASQEGVIGWFTSLDSEEPISSNTQIQIGSHTYYVAQRKNHCWSPKVAVTVNVNAIPEVLSNTPQQLCGVFTLADASLGQVAGATVKFYTSLTSTENLPMTTPLVSGTYYVSQTVGGCESARVAVSFVVAEVLPAPQASQTQTYCGSTRFTDLEATASTGVLGWFTSADSTTPVNMSEFVQLGTRTYYVAQRNAHCWSPKVAVSVTVNNVPASLNNTSQNFCGVYRFSDVNVGSTTGAVVNWYVSEDAVATISLNETLQSGTYYISQTLNGCESPRLPITIGVTGALNRPIAGTQTICGSGTVSDLVAQGDEGNTIVWFSSLTSNTPLAPTSVLSSGTYYVAQTRNGCLSDKRAVAVRVVSQVAPQVNPILICGSGTVADLVIPSESGATHKWYSLSTSTVELSQNTALTTGVYFVERVYFGCVSARTAVQVTIGAIPNAPTGATTQTFIEGSTISNLIVNQNNVTWYASYNDSQSGTNALVLDMPLVNATTYYAVVIGTNGCPSLPLAVTVNVYLSNDEFVKDELKYYPNPVEDILNINYSERILQIEVFDLLGKRVKTVNTDNNNVELNLSDLASGTYMIQLKSENKQQFIKIIKK